MGKGRISPRLAEVLDQRREDQRRAPDALRDSLSARPSGTEPATGVDFALADAIAERWCESQLPRYRHANSVSRRQATDLARAYLALRSSPPGVPDYPAGIEPTEFEKLLAENGRLRADLAALRSTPATATSGHWLDDVHTCPDMTCSKCERAPAAPTQEGEFGELLDNYGLAQQRLGVVAHLDHGKLTRKRNDAIEQVAAARSRLVAQNRRSRMSDFHGFKRPAPSAPAATDDKGVWLSDFDPPKDRVAILPKAISEAHAGGWRSTPAPASPEPSVTDEDVRRAMTLWLGVGEPMETIFRRVLEDYASRRREK